MDLTTAIKTIKDASEKELQEELERRRAKAITAPTPLANPDFKKLIECVKFGVNEMVEKGYEDEDFSGYVYEVAMTAVYGPDYWKWRRAQRF